MQTEDSYTVEKVPGVKLEEFKDVFGALERTYDGTVFLETQTPGGASILAWNPVASIEVGHDTVNLQCSGDFRYPVPSLKPPDVPRFLQEILDRYSIWTDGTIRDALPFIGGFLGFVSYEWATGQELDLNRSIRGIPEMWFGLYDRALVSNPRGEIFLITVHSLRGATVEGARKQLHEAISRKVSPITLDSMESVRSLSYDFPKEEFETGVREIKKLIRSGDVYQVNIAQRIRCSRVDPLSLYARSKRVNPSPYGGILSTEKFTIVSNSPERLLKVSIAPDGTRWASTRPIAGTRPRGAGEIDTRYERALRTSPKERAEHTMLVDLSRNDLGRVSEGGSVEVDELMTVERYSHVMHLVSNVKGKLSPSARIPELFRSLMPGGSVTGTPKIRANSIISEIEPVPRGAYTGSIGYISLDGRMDFNILIRSAYYPEGSNETFIYSGCGIVHDSIPLREWNESREKAKAMLESILDTASSGHPWASPNRSSFWKQPFSGISFSGTRVLLIDNYDSFTYNIVQYLSALGAMVTVVRNDEATIPELKAIKPSHVVISPGPGKAEDSGVSIEAILAFEGIPTMGVCLGHQAIVEAYGGSVRRAHLPMHGKASTINRVSHPGIDDFLKGLPSTFTAARYHSLLAGEIPESLLVTARTKTGEIMAVQHRTLPLFGVQFHPESILTQRGTDIFANFLDTSPGRES